MVKFNFWDKYFGERPKTFLKDAEDKLKKNSLYYMEAHGRSKWVKTEEIFERTLEKTDFFNTSEGKMWFAIQGIKSRINWAMHQLRKEDKPIIAGHGTRGYRYADESCEDFIHLWNEKFNAWSARVDDTRHERENDKRLIEMLIERLKSKNREKEVEQMQEILVKYSNVKVKEQDNDE